MKFSEYILESRVDDFKSKFSQKFDKDTLNKMSTSIQPKYLMWAGSVLDPVNLQQNLSNLIGYLQSFDKLSSNLPKTDINQYKSLSELMEELNNYVNRERRQYKQVEGGNVVYQDERFYVVNPLTYESSCYFGKGTKWCTAGETNSHFNQYNTDGKLFYIIDKALPTSDPNYKVALLYKFDGDKSFWDARDDKMPNNWFESHNPSHTQILSSVNKYLESNFKEQLEIFRDKERAKQERARLEKLRIQRLINERREEAQERRETGEWDLTNPNLDEEGLRANALLKWLESNADYQILTTKDRQQIDSLKSEIERLNSEYDNSEESRTDLLDSISELEDELQEYNEYIDVYSLIPVGEFYRLHSFELVNESPGGTQYAVGDSREMQQSAEEYVEQLIDDVGYEGFNQNFVSDYIDEDEVLDYFRSFYDDDVNENPDVYFSDDQRNLSRAQVDSIKFNNSKIEQLRKFIEHLNETMEETEDEEEVESIQERIDELEEQITELEEENDDTESSPDGDFPDDLIEAKVDDLVDDVKYDIQGRMEEFGLEIKHYIDKDKFIEGVIDADGYGMVNGYDGTVDEVYVKDILFYVMRIN